MLRSAILILVLGSLAHGQTHQVKLNGHTFTLPQGFTIELVAKSPQVDRPISASFDDQGRLYVTDSSGSNAPPAEQLKNPTHRIMRLESTKGDGVFDKSVVFADKMMFPEGCLWYRGSVYCAAPPHIWKLTDTDGDGKADKREIWFDGKTVTGCANDLHGPYLGPDGWIYWCKGAFAKQEYTLPNGKKFTTRASHIFRARADGTGIEPVMTGGMDNPVGLAFLPNGERFFTTTFFQHPEAGRRDGLIHAIYGGIYGKDHDVIYDKDHKWTSPELMPVMTHMGPAAPCGLICYQSSFFGKEFQTNLFACQFNLRKVSRHVLRPHGSTYRTEDSDFVVSDNQDFHPTDVVEDADGSLLIVDTGGWYKLCCPSSQLVKADVLGAIYRVKKVGAQKVEDPWGRNIDPRTHYSNIVLDDPRPIVRQIAVNRIATSDAVGLRILENLLANKLRKDEQPSSPQTRITALWGASQSQHRAASLAIVSSLKDPDKQVRETALHCLSVSKFKEAVPNTIPLLKSDSMTVRRLAAEALGRIGDEKAVPAILEALASETTDRPLEHALTYALIEIGEPVVTATGLKHKSEAVRRATLVALDQMGSELHSRAVYELFDSADQASKQTALWILGRHEDGGDVVAWMIKNRFTSDVVPIAARLARTPPVQKALLEVIGADKEYSVAYSRRRHALAALRQAGGKELPASWAIAIAKSIKSDWFFANDAIEVVRAFPAAKPGIKELDDVLRERISNVKASVTTRLTAMCALPGGLPKLNEEEFSLASSSLIDDKAVALRGLAAEVLSKAKLTPAQLEALIAVLPNVGPLELDRVLTAFAQSKDDAIGQKLLAALNSPELRPSLRADQVKERIKHFGPAVQKEAEKLYAALNADYEQQRAKLEETVKTLPTGDIRRGQAVFNSQKASCIACHTIGYVGGKIGPDLTRIGGIRNERDLLESILFPSASFVRSYEPLSVTTKDGRVFNGAPKKDAPDEIILVLAADKEVRIARDDIEEVRPGKVSIMPAGLDKQITPQELADLIAFLRACK